MKTTNFITLPNGRKLAYAEFGDPDGHPVIHFLATFKKQMSAADYAVLKPPHRIEAYCKSTIEAMYQGTKGPDWDVQLYLRPWDFKTEEIQIPLKFFHGEQDKTIPIALAKRFIDRLPTAKLVTYPDEGHISIVVNQFETIVQALKSDRLD